MTKEESSNPGVAILFAVLVVIILCLGMFVIFNKDSKRQKEEPIEKGLSYVAGKKVESSYDIEIIKNNQVILKNYMGTIMLGPSLIYEKDVTAEELDPEKKLLSVLFTLSKNGEFVELIPGKYPNIPEPKADGILTRIVLADRVREVYKRIYGEELDAKIPIKEWANNNFGYNEEYDMFYEYPGYGGACIPYTDTYDYLITEDDKHFYVYSTMVLETCDGVYKDIAKTELTDYKYAELKITKDNFKEFHQYEITYNKDYTFNKIQKVK